MNRQIILPLICALGFAAADALAWSNHTYAAYRVFEKMPEVAGAAPVMVEPLEAFLKAEEKSVEALLNSQEAWAMTELEVYPPRPAELAFKAQPAASNEQRRLAFLRALRVAPNSRFALYLQVDPWGSAPVAAQLLPHSAFDTLPEQPNSTYRFVALKAGELVAPLAVLASATDEPDYGLDINLWSDSPSEWGRIYGLGAQPFGNPALYFASQAPFHMGFYNENPILYQAAPFLKKTFPLLRIHQYSSLAKLALRTGHAYWGWRFAGLALHYVQDLTQPYHASLSPGKSAIKLIGINLLAMAGFARLKDEMIVLLSNHHFLLEKYQHQWLYQAAQARQETRIEQALRDSRHDGVYLAWSDFYARDVVGRQAYTLGGSVTGILLATMPPAYESDPGFDFGVHESTIDLLAQLRQIGSNPAANEDKQDRLKQLTAQLMANFGAHSRNTMRGILLLDP
jgi:hypothetical protein